MKKSINIVKMPHLSDLPSATKIIGLRALPILTILLALVTLTPALASSNNDATNRIKPDPLEREITKTDILDWVKAFAESETSEDPDVKESFRWRTFRKTIEGLSTPDHATWLIETLPLWPDGQDQGSLCTMSSKVAELTTPAHIKQLLEILRNPNIDDWNKSWAIECIARVSNKECYPALQEIVLNPSEWVTADPQPQTNPVRAASRALSNSKKKDNLEFLLKILEKNQKSGTQEETLQNKAIISGIKGLGSYDE
jgi:hypothetical protein